MAGSETIHSHDETAEDEYWYAEVEMRSLLGDELADNDRGIVPPNTGRANRREDFSATSHADALQEWAQDGYIELHDDRIRIPREHADDAREIAQSLFEHMAVMPLNEQSKRASGGLVEVYTRIPNQEEVQNASKSKFYNQKAGTYPLTNERFSDVDPRPIYAEVPPDHELNELTQMWEKRRQQGRDMKMLVVARDGATGTGKTTLAVALAKSWDADGWDASKATLDGEEYIDRYTDLSPGEILLGDELEGMADSRRSMSSHNLTLTQYWMTMRQWEVSTITTMPSADVIDKRLRHLADLYVVVTHRGAANVYETKIDDTTGERRLRKLHRVRWDAMDDDPDYQQLAQMKKEHMENYSERAYHVASEDQEDDDHPSPDEIQRDYRLDVIEQMHDAGYTQSEIAAALPDITDRSTVSRLLNR